MVDTMARQNRMAVKGLMKAPANRCPRDFFFSWVTLLLPYLERLADTARESKPHRFESSSSKTILMEWVASKLIS